MSSNIIVAVLGVIAVAAGIIAWRADNGGGSEKPEQDRPNTENEKKKGTGKNKH